MEMQVSWWRNLRILKFENKVPGQFKKLQQNVNKSEIFWHVGSELNFFFFSHQNFFLQKFSQFDLFQKNFDNEVASLRASVVVCIIKVKSSGIWVLFYNQSMASALSERNQHGEK